MTAYSTLHTAIRFHLPQDTKRARAAARKFIRAVRAMMHHESVVISRGNGAGMVAYDQSMVSQVLLPLLPDDAELRLTPITDKQIQISRTFWGKMRKGDENTQVA